MRVRIVCYEDVDAWILGKFALKLRENLNLLGVEADISKTPDPTADINHHIIYFDYDGKINSIDTVFVTHIDSLKKKELLQQQLVNAALGICMSRETMVELSTLGIPRERLAFINPAHDSVIQLRPKTIGLTCRVQDDGRKREAFLSNLSNDLDPAYFEFKIMGEGWDKQVALLEQNGFKVEYTNHFVYDKYIELIPSLDYYLYMGKDEGQMGFIDALAAGVETIVTSQGYHLDAKNGITYPFDSYDDLKQIFLNLTEERKMLINSVSDWNWLDYTKKHLEIWEYLINKKNNNLSKPFISQYADGLNSLKEFSNIHDKSQKGVFNLYLTLLKGNLSHQYYQRKASITQIYTSNGIKGILKKITSKFKISI